MNAIDLFAKEWMSFGLDGIQPQDPNGSSADGATLPAVPPLEPTCRWLPKLPARIDQEMSPHRPSDTFRQAYSRKREAIIQQAQVAGVSLPPLFLAISGSRQWQDRIPSCTACYFDLPDDLMASPFRQGDYLLRFLNDQQVTVCWYLYLPHDDDAFVISSSGDGDEPFLDTIDFQDDPDAITGALENTAVVAKSFDDFIYRFWIENLIWFNLEFELPMSAAELDYIRHIVPGFDDPNAASE
jgi:hypothetical protein